MMFSLRQFDEMIIFAYDDELNENLLKVVQKFGGNQIVKANIIVKLAEIFKEVNHKHSKRS
jgi:predicted SpoU family rRNA methylase